MRGIKIATWLVATRNLGTFTTTLKHALFRNDAILVFVYDLSEPLPPAEAFQHVSIKICKGSLTRLERLVDRDPLAPWEFRCNQFDGVQDFFVALDEGGIQHISWIYYHHHPNRVLCLTPMDAEIKYALTLERFRGQGLYPRVLRSIAGYLREKRFRRVFICVSEDNRSSIRGIEKAGFKRIARMRLLKIAGIQVSRKLALGGE